MLSTLSSDKMAWLVSLGIADISNAKRRLFKMNRFILISLLLNCPNGPNTHTTRFTYHEAIATILGALDEPAKSALAVLCTDSRTHHTMPRIASFLAGYLLQCIITTVNNSWYFQCKICPNDTPDFDLRHWGRHSQWALYLSITDTEQMGRKKCTDCPNFADAHSGCNIYSCMNVDRLHQLLKVLFKDHTWEWIVDVLKDIYDQEKYLDRIDERFTIIPLFSTICQFGDKLTHVKQLTGADYNNMVKVWLVVLAPVHNGCHNYFQFIKSVSDFIVTASYHFHTKTTLNYLQDTLCGICCNIHLFLPYRKSYSMSKLPTIHSFPHCIEWIREMGSASNSDTKISEAADTNLIKNGYHSSNRVKYIPQMLQLEYTYLISSQWSVFYYIFLKQILFHQRHIYPESFLWGILLHLTNNHCVWYLTSMEWWANVTGLQFWHFRRVSAYQSLVMLWYPSSQYF